MGEKGRGKSTKREEEMEREERERLGSLVHVCVAQTVDNGTEVDGRPTALLMEQLKCGRWLSHAMAITSYDLSGISYRYILSFSWTGLIVVVRIDCPEPETSHSPMGACISLVPDKACVVTLFVGCIIAYFQLHMFLLKEIPEDLQPHAKKGSEVLIMPTRAFKKGLGYFFNGATRVSIVLWPCKYLPVIHCWRMLREAGLGRVKDQGGRLQTWMNGGMVVGVCFALVPSLQCALIKVLLCFFQRLWWVCLIW